METKQHEKQTILDAFRYNSGSHFLDSGSAYGRHHEREPINPDVPSATFDVYGDDVDGATIETALFLAERCDVLRDYQYLFDGWSSAENVRQWKSETMRDLIRIEYLIRNHPYSIRDFTDSGKVDPDLVIFAESYDEDEIRELIRTVKNLPDDNSGSWFELGDSFCEALGFAMQARDNTYNSENDLSQQYVWELWTREPEPSDWIYTDPEETIFVVYAHTGCDVRGGYAYPLFLRHTGDYSIPIDITAQFGAISGFESEDRSKPIDRDELQRLDEKWQCGYSSFPFGQLRESVERWIPETMSEDKTEIDAVLQSGEVVRIACSTPWI